MSLTIVSTNSGSTNTVDGKGSLSNNFSVIFPSFVHLLATKHMDKQSRASGQISGGHWVEYRAEIFIPKNIRKVKKIKLP